MAGDEVTYESLMNRWRKETRGSALSKIEPGFWQGLDEHLRALQEDYQREHEVNPNAPKVMILQDELRNLTRARDDLYDLRERKIVLAALISARGGTPDRTAMTRGEQDLYEELVRALRDGRRALLRRGEREERPEPSRPRGGPPAPPEPATDPPPPAARPAALLEVPPAIAPEAVLPGLPPPSASVSSAPAAAPPDVRAPDGAPPSRRRGRALVRVTGEVPPFTASDLRTYHLRPRDLASVPREAARALVARGLANALAASGADAAPQSARVPEQAT